MQEFREYFTIVQFLLHRTPRFLPGSFCIFILFSDNCCRDLLHQIIAVFIPEQIFDRLFLQTALLLQRVDRVLHCFVAVRHERAALGRGDRGQLTRGVEHHRISRLRKRPQLDKVVVALFNALAGRSQTVASAISDPKRKNDISCKPPSSMEEKQGKCPAFPFSTTIRFSQNGVLPVGIPPGPHA